MESVTEALLRRDAEIEAMREQLQRQDAGILRNNAEIERLQQYNEKLLEDQTTLCNYLRMESEEIERLKEEVCMKFDAEAVDRSGNTRGTKLSEIIDKVGESKFSEVKSPADNRTILWHHPDRSLQLHSREVLNSIAYCWSKDIGIPKLNKDSIRICHGKAIIIGAGKNRNYVSQFRNFLQSVFGPSPHNKVFQSLNKRLRDQPGMSFFEEISAFPALAYEKLKSLRGVPAAMQQISSWTSMYDAWVENTRGRNPADFDLVYDVLDDKHASRILYYGKGPERYTKHFHQEVRFVRNLIIHFNDHQSQRFDLRNVGLFVFTTFPHIGQDLFDFFFEHHIDVDFFACCRKYELL